MAASCPFFLPVHCPFCGSKWCWLGFEFGTGGARFVVLKCQPALAAPHMASNCGNMFCLTFFSPFSGALQPCICCICIICILFVYLLQLCTCVPLVWCVECVCVCVGNRGLCAHGPRLNYHLPGANSYK